MQEENDHFFNFPLNSCICGIVRDIMEKIMAKNLIMVNTNSNILKYDNRKAIELAQTLGRPLTGSEYESLKIQKTANYKKQNTLRIAGVSHFFI